mmetsp:Transcript_15182/g.41955  ORF Transcript_15182/g.41955 Transcript_15182/m.41955 type:complete len:245 (-) Transcript_15182:578-1312(-)
MSDALHGVPPEEAPRRILRFRIRLAPPQVAAQMDQSFQSSHSQSTSTHGASPSHGATSDRTSVHDARPPSGRLSTSRLRVRTPVPQVLQHGSHGDQLLTMQLECPSHGCVLHGSVFIRLSGQLLPPFLGYCLMCLCQRCCPPPQELEQSSKMLQFATKQSTGDLSQALASLRTALHSAPPFREGIKIPRVRYCWLSMHLLQFPQSSSTQSTGSAPQGSLPQGSSSESWLSHVFPPELAGCRRKR